MLPYLLIELTKFTTSPKYVFTLHGKTKNDIKTAHFGSVITVRFIKLVVRNFYSVRLF